jgi:hypothetical protein
MILPLSLRAEGLRFFDKLRMSGEENEIAMGLAPIAMTESRRGK